MGKIVRCAECGEVYRSLNRLEDLRDNDSICLVCNAPIEVPDWDRVLASYEDDDFDDVDDLDEVDETALDDDWRGDDEDEVDSGFDVRVPDDDDADDDDDDEDE